MRRVALLTREYPPDVYGGAGVHVEYTVVEDPVQRFNAFKAGRLNAIATTVDTFSRTYAKGIPSVQVLGLDASVGGDGIVAEKDITSPEQLKGQEVAVSEGSTSQWLLAYVLDQEGLSLDDVKQVDLTSADAGAAFRYRADAAFPLSDHADYEDLIAFVRAVEPKRVFTMHGFAAEFAADLRALGIEAWALGEPNQLDLRLG